MSLCCEVYSYQEKNMMAKIMMNVIKSPYRVIFYVPESKKNIKSFKLLENDIE